VFLVDEWKKSTSHVVAGARVVGEWIKGYDHLSPQTLWRTYSNYGDRCFAAAGLKLWNSLLSELRQADINFQRFEWLLNIFLFGCWDHGAWRLTVKAVPQFSDLLCITICIVTCDWHWSFCVYVSAVSDGPLVNLINTPIMDGEAFKLLSVEVLMVGFGCSFVISLSSDSGFNKETSSLTHCFRRCLEIVVVEVEFQYWSVLCSSDTQHCSLGCPTPIPKVSQLLRF